MRWLAVTALVAGALAASAAAHPLPRPPLAVERALHAAWGWGRDYRIALCIAWHESRYRPRAVSSTGDHGLMQLHRATWDPRRNPAAARVVGRVDWGRIYEVAYNVQVARRIWRSHGWDAWRTYRYCR